MSKSFPAQDAPGARRQAGRQLHTHAMCEGEREGGREGGGRAGWAATHVIASANRCTSDHTVFFDIN